MDVERTIEFLVENQVRMDARWDVKFAKADRRFEQAERRLDRMERAVSQLVRYGVSLRSDVRRIDKALAQATESLSETDAKLNALITVVDQHLRGNGQKK